MSQVLKYKEVFGKILESKLPFVLYKKPEEEEVYGLIQKDINMWFVQDFEKDRGFVFAPFNNKEEMVLLKSDAKLTFEMDDLDVTSSFKSIDVNGMFDEKVKGPNAQKDKEEFQEKVSKAISEIKKGEIDKIVISRNEIWKANKVNFSAIFRDLVNTYDDALVYIWFHPLVGMWIGATPEMFLTKDDNYVHTTSLAGTKHVDDKVEWGGKELKEQKIVTDYIVNILDKNLVSSIRAFGPETVTAGKLEHLKTDITGELSNSSNINYLVRSLHPTPAVCGTPLKKSLDFINNTEGYNRDFYAGFLGELNIDKHTELYVNLRCLQVVKEGVKLFVGSGITEESDAEKEWEETVKKASTLKDVILNHLS